MNPLWLSGIYHRLKSQTHGCTLAPFPAQCHWLSLLVLLWQCHRREMCHSRQGWPSSFTSLQQHSLEGNKGFAKCMHIPEGRHCWRIVRACSGVAACSRVRSGMQHTPWQYLSALAASASRQPWRVNDIFPRPKHQLRHGRLPLRSLVSHTQIESAAMRGTKIKQKIMLTPIEGAISTPLSRLVIDRICDQLTDTVLLKSIQV